jgi:4-hydroxybenzoate polyprenyltransferase
MPLIDLFLTGLEWVPGGGASPHLWLFLALSFVNGCVLEIGRKLWAPENEIVGVDTYSGLWGIKQAAMVWAICLFASFALLCGIGGVTGSLGPVAVLGGVGLIFGALRLRSYVNQPTPEAQEKIDTISGLWVFLCYGVAGFVPLIFGAT